MTIDKTKLRELAQAAKRGPWQATEKMDDRGRGKMISIHAAYDDKSKDDTIAGIWSPTNKARATGIFIAAADPQTVLALLDELQAMTEERNSLMDDALKFAAQHDELKRLALAHLDALALEARASMTAENASANFTDPTPEQEAYRKAMFATDAAGKALRKAIES